MHFRTLGQPETLNGMLPFESGGKSHVAVINIPACKIFIFARNARRSLSQYSFQYFSLEKKQLPHCNVQWVAIISCSCLLIKCVQQRHLIGFSYLQRHNMAYTRSRRRLKRSPARSLNTQFPHQAWLLCAEKIEPIEIFDYFSAWPALI